MFPGEHIQDPLIVCENGCVTLKVMYRYNDSSIIILDLLKISCSAHFWYEHGDLE